MEITMNEEFVLRFSKYKRLLSKFKAMGLERVYSNNLGDALGITSSLVRKDFSSLKLSGNKRGGYNIDAIIKQFNNILGKNKPQEFIIVGCGKMGTALMQYSEFEKENLHVAAGFDINPSEPKGSEDVPVYSMTGIEEFIQKNQIQVGVITVPESAAKNVFDILINSGIKAVLNFAPVELKCIETQGCPHDVVVHNMDIGLEIENIFNLLIFNKDDSIAVNIQDEVPAAYFIRTKCTRSESSEPSTNVRSLKMPRFLNSVPEIMSSISLRVYIR